MKQKESMVNINPNIIIISKVNFRDTREMG
jgi:hypothetical protein